MVQKGEQGLFVLRCLRAVMHKHQTADTGSLARRGFVDLLGDFEAVRYGLGDFDFVVLVGSSLATRFNDLDVFSLVAGVASALAVASWDSLASRASRRRRLLR